MADFFIRRPVFAWVLSLFIVLFGALALPQLPITRYPSVAPPTVSIQATYPGATPQTLTDSVVTPVERELSSVKGLLYFESSADASGSASVTATFKPGTDPAMAQVEIQNRLKSIEPRLPQAVRQNGLSVESASANFLMIVGLTSDDPAVTEVTLSDYMARTTLEELRRIEGVGRVQLFGAEQALRVWVDPAKLIGYGLTLSDVTTAISRQNIQIAPGRLGDAPTVPGQRISVPLTVQSQLTSVEDFAAVVIRAQDDGSRVLLQDVARVELGAQSYGFSTTENGRTATAAAVMLSPGGNAVRTAQAVADRLQQLSPSLPAGMRYTVPFNTAPFVKISIHQVLTTLAEAMVLVFLVMLLFLQNVRYTLIPAIVAPIALLGTLTVMLLAGYSINVLTMFGMVLAIGIIVDDAIVVVENVERLMATEGLAPKEATRRAMKDISGAVVGITLVLTAVFLPMAFSSGSVGVIYRQFSLSMAVSILFSAFLALTLTPALCATLLQPLPQGHAEHRGFFGLFNRQLARMTDRYASGVTRLIHRPVRMMLGFLAVSAALLLGFRLLPAAFLPEEDQGYFMTMFQLPAEATAERTIATVKAYERHLATRTAIDSNMSIVGFGMSGSGANTAMAYTNLKDWPLRQGATTAEEAKLAQQAMASQEGLVMSLMPPAIEELGSASGFSLRLLDQANRGPQALKAAREQLLALAANSPLLANVYAEDLPDGSSIRLEIDRQKARALGVDFNELSDTLSTAMGSQYVNDFPNRGRMQQVIVQADAGARMQISDVLRMTVRNDKGGLVRLSEMVTPMWQEAPLQKVRYQGYPAARITGAAAPGVSSGAAMAEMETLAASLPKGFALAWVGQSLQERDSAAQAPLLMALSMLVVFLVLAALYESWSIPLSVMLVVPLGLIGAVAAVLLRGLPNDVFFKVGLITVIGLSAKNAILIVEFAKQLRDQGLSLHDAAVKAARLRLRPLLMTSLAFALGVLPLMLASGAAAESQRAIGTGVFGGMLGATVLAIFFVPVFFVVVLRAADRLSDRMLTRQRRRRGATAADGQAHEAQQYERSGK